MTYRCAPGRCYVDAAHILLAMPPERREVTLLAHGWPRLQAEDQGHPRGARYGHAWLEWHTSDLGWVAHDCLTEITLPRDAFYRLGEIEFTEVRRYGHLVTEALLSRHGHYGPWHEGPPEAVWRSEIRQ